MKVAVVGSRNLSIDDLGKYLPDGVTEIISGGARGEKPGGGAEGPSVLGV